MSFRFENKITHFFSLSLSTSLKAKNIPLVLTGLRFRVRNRLGAPVIVVLQTED